MSIPLIPCTCGNTKIAQGLRPENLFYTLTCTECRRAVSAFDKPGVAAAWNGESLVGKPKLKRAPCENRSDFESDHAGPFDAALDPEGNELDEYANGRTQADWLLWLRAQAAAGVVAQELMNQIDQLRAGVGRLQNRSV